MGTVRSYSPHVRWTKGEEEIIRLHYPTAPITELEAMLPGRGRRTIQCKANEMGVRREKPPKRTPDEIRAAKAAHMARKRAANPDAARAYQNAHRAKNRDRLNAKTRENTSRRLFWARALRLRNGITARDLAKIWRNQRGLCALTGDKLDRTAEIDHKIPRSRGGDDSLGNLQWVTRAANRAKRDLTDEEFLLLCKSCVRWIGERIDAAFGVKAFQEEAA